MAYTDRHSSPFIPFILFLGLLFSEHSLPSSELQFKHVNSNNDLSLTDHIVTAIAQDQKGFIWFTTHDGLNRYDGYKITPYQNLGQDINSPLKTEFYGIIADSVDNLWVVSFVGGLYKFTPSTNKLKQYTHDPDNPNSLLPGYIWDLKQDSAGNLWISTLYGLNRFNPTTNVFTTYQHEPNNPQSLSSNFLTFIYPLSTKEILIGTDGAGLNLLYPENKSVKRFLHDKKQQNSISDNQIRGITRDINNNIWVLTKKGVDLWIKDSNVFKHYFDNKDNVELVCIASDQNGIVWVCSQNGLYKLNPKTKKINHYTHNEYNPRSLSTHRLLKLFVDKSNTLWVGTIGKGASMANLNAMPFDYHKHIPENSNTISYNNIKFIVSLSDSNTIWLQSYDGKLYELNENNKISKKYSDSFFGSPSKKNIDIYHTVAGKNNILWLGTNHDKIIKFNTKTATINRYPYIPPELINKVKGGLAAPRYFDSLNRLWYSIANNPLGYLDTLSGEIKIFNDPDGVVIEFHSITENNGIIWIASSNGLKMFDEENQRLQLVNSIPSYTINHMLSDNNNILWLGTSHGLIKFNTATKSYIHYTEKSHGISNSSIKAIVKDEQDNLWISTNYGLNKFDPEKNTFTSYYKNDGLLTNQFNNSTASYNQKTKKMYFGSSDGIVIFKPDKIGINTNIPNTVISHFRVNNKEISLMSNKLDHPISKDINYAENITLSYNENDFSIELAALDYINPAKNKFAYKLEGFHEDWINISYSDRRISFTGLQPNNYTLLYKGSNNHGIWSNAINKLAITILPPWWKTPWAYTTYIILICIVLFLFIRMRINVLTKRAKLLEQTVSERTNELVEKNHTIEDLLSEKDMIFTNISHEFRTPLTLILGPAQTISNETKKDSIHKYACIIQRNANRLLRLVNQLLELSRLQHQTNSKSKAPRPKQTIHINPITDIIISTFTTISNEKSITLSTHLQKDLLIYCSADAYEKIIINLLSNAFKYTLQDGHINLSAFFEKQSGLVTIKVKDTGIGIAKEKQQEIFEKFTRLDTHLINKISGTGIGLALVKDLVKDNSGHISLESEEGTGTEFIIQIPGTLAQSTILPEQANRSAENHLDDIKNLHNLYSDDLALEKTNLTDEAISPLIFEINKTALTNDMDKQYQLLIIEDNTDLCYYLHEIYQHKYNCIIATNGKDGIQLAKQAIPDIILCDIMMPEMNGYEVCRYLKNDGMTSHIPIILLTALGDYDHKLMGLKEQADDYLTKPFEQQELSIRLENLIIIRENLKSHFSIQQTTDVNMDHNPIPFIQYSGIANPKDTKFVKQFENILEQNFHKSTFTIDHMADSLHMNKRQIHRKATAIIGDSPGNILRSFRMYKGKLLLRQGKSITETAFSVGYEYSNHFSSTFKSCFKISPKQYQNKLFNENKTNKIDG